MDESKHRFIEDQIDKAQKHLQTARDHLSYASYSESIEASQECIELSVKAILDLLDIEYPLYHWWNKEEFSSIIKQIQERQLLDKLKAQNLYYSTRLPRLLLLFNMWGASSYLTAKYGIKHGYLASAKDLFEKQEAGLAVQHADECYRAASELRYLSEDKLAAIVSQAKDLARPKKEDHPELGYLIHWYDRQGGIGPTPPPDAIAVDGEILVETLSYHIDSNTIAFWLEDGRFGTIQIHSDLRGSVPKQWRITSFSSPWRVKNLTMIKFRVVGD